LEVITLERWCSIAGVYSKGGTFKMFVDGKLTSEQNLPEHGR
jgi:hypothetical protein